MALPIGITIALGLSSKNQYLAQSVKQVNNFIRFTPLLVQLYFAYYVLPESLALPAMLLGIIVITVHYSSYMAIVFQAGFLSVPKEQREAAQVLNFSGAQIFVRILFPQAFRKILPNLGNYLIAMFKDTPLLSVITIVEVLQQAKIIGSNYFRYLEPLTVVGILYLTVSLIASYANRKLEQKLALP